jgi:hypothetical protein
VGAVKPSEVIMKKFIIVMLLSGCSYRYGTNSFVVGNDPPEARPTYVQTNPVETFPVESPVAVTPPTPTVTAKPVDPPMCRSELDRMVIINKLNSKDNTIETTAESTRTEHKSVPCE